MDALFITAIVLLFVLTAAVAVGFEKLRQDK